MGMAGLPSQWVSALNSYFLPTCSLCSKRFHAVRSKERGARVKDRPKNGPSFIFWFLFHVSCGQNRHMITFLGPSLLQNRTETLVTQASLHVDKGLLLDTRGTTFWEKPSTMQTCNGTNVNRTGRRTVWWYVDEFQGKAPKACPKTCPRGVKKYPRDADITLLNPTEDEKNPITCVNWLSRYPQNRIY